MIESIKALISEFRQNPLSAFCGLMVAAIVYLVLMLIEQQNRMDALQVSYRNEVIAVERACASKQEAAARERLDDLKQATERQSKIEAELRKLRKR